MLNDISDSIYDRVSNYTKPEVGLDGFFVSFEGQWSKSKCSMTFQTVFMRGYTHMEVGLDDWVGGPLTAIMVNIQNVSIDTCQALSCYTL